jgi:hypothetical protein
MPQIVTNDGLVLPLSGSDPDPLTERRVVLAKPGDLLLIGNAGDYVADPQVGDFFESLGLKVAVFAGDIDIDLLPGGGARA